MIELLAVEPPAHEAIEQIAYIETVGRFVSFHLPSGGGVPETRATPVLLIAASDLSLQVGGEGTQTHDISLVAGQAHLLPEGLAGLANVGAQDARFTLIDLPTSEE